MFCEVDCKFKQNAAREGKTMQNFDKIHQKYAKLCEKMPFSCYKTAIHVFKAFFGPEWILSVLCTFMKVFITFERCFCYF